jgi:hypothetical protein
MNEKVDRPIGSRKFLQWGGKYYVVHNAAQRIQPGDAAIIAPLTRAETEHYRDGREEGHTDTSLYQQLFSAVHDRSGSSVPVPLKILQDRQLVQLIKQRLGEGTQGLERLDRKTLETILRALHGQ